MERPEYMTASARIKFGARGVALFGYVPPFGRPRADRNVGPDGLMVAPLRRISPIP
jgi:hypothetical protein